MAARRKKKAVELESESDPKAALSGEALLAVVKPLLKELSVDLLSRADGSPAVTEALKARHAEERKAERTADGFPEWRRAFVEQVAAAWMLSCVFVRTLEDRGLLGRNRIAGVGAEDSWKAFLQLAPSLSEREYLLAVFRELSRLPAAADLFDARHNPVWLLAPSAEGARKLLELFRGPSVEAPAFRFGGADTRFLGDLYQDLSEDVRKRYALLQTPRFVERFILDRTLDPAIERFGLDETTLIDPTCGSGHFLLGAFERLFDRRLHAEPGLSAREAATKALDAIAGADINPYAIAIARFRLTLAFVEKCGVGRLRDAPRLPLHLAVADSLLYNPQVGQLALVEGTDPAAWEGAHFALEDPKAARDVLLKQYAAVVGNPPYITVKDAVLRDRYREYYRSAAMQYSLGAPFTERFFQLGREGASVGLITANSFMKREFGKPLVARVLPTVNLELIVNISGAYIPGHGTPTVLLFGTRERPKGARVRAVLAKRGEPTTPTDPEKGAVWSSVAMHWCDDGFENDYISVAALARDLLATHPWSLGGGGAGELKQALEDRAVIRLGALARSIGRVAHTGNDEAFVASRDSLLRGGLGAAHIADFVEGEVLRDWALGRPTSALFPYEIGDGLRRCDERADDARLRWLWPYRTMLWERREPNGTHREIGLTWFEYSRFHPERFEGMGIAFPFVATHNHFVLDRGGKVFKQTAPVIKLPDTATEDEYLALLAYLNSSTACFYLRQILHSKGAQGVNEGHKAEEWEQFLEFSGTQVATVPLPPHWQSLAGFGQALSDLAGERSSLDPLDDQTPEKDHALMREMVGVQETLDSCVYRLFGLTDTEVQFGPTDAGHRAFEVELARSGTRTAWFSRHGYSRPTEAECASRQRGLSAELQLLEQPLFKRRWLLTDWSSRQRFARRDAALQSCEALAARSSSVLTRNRLVASVNAGSGGDAEGWLRESAVPYLTAWRHTPAGIEKRAAWEHTWSQQHREDLGENVGGVPIPPKYDQKDYSEARYFPLRGKLDVPKERFISYPGCESNEDDEPVYGWAGWDHLQRAVALAGLYQDRKQREGWTKDRLMPMLAGLLELLPWLKLWHSDPSTDLGGERPSNQFEAFINAECSEHGWTHEALRGWRPTVVRPARRKRKTEEDVTP